MSHVVLEVMNHPAAVLFLFVCFSLFFLKYTGMTYLEFVQTSNIIGTQLFAVVILVIGFWMLVVCHYSGIDTTIAGGVIGVASNMLQAQLKDAAHLQPGDIPPGGSVKTSQNTIISSAPDTPKVEDATVVAASTSAAPVTQPAPQSPTPPKNWAS